MHLLFQIFRLLLGILAPFLIAALKAPVLRLLWLIGVFSHVSPKPDGLFG